MSDLRGQQGWQPREVGAVIGEHVGGFNLELRPVTGSTSPAWPVVTISREFGTLGVELGYRVAERLGFSCWDRDLVTQIARELDTDEEAVDRLDEHARNKIEELLGAKIFSKQPTSSSYLDRLRAIVSSICERGGAVIVGRGAQFLVDPRRALRVRLVAPFESRVRSVQERMQISLDTATRGVRAGDRDRAEFARVHFGQESSNPEHYDLVINTDVYTPHRADSLVLMAYLAKFGELPKTTGKEPERFLQRPSTLPPLPSNES